MRIHGLLVALILFVTAISSTAALAGEPFGRLAPYWRTPAPYYVGNPKLILPKTDALRTAQHSRAQSIGPYAYPYGNFGARTRPYAAKSFGYYEAYSQTSYGFGY
ncbi:MAG: hypothetical protein IT426_07910 [Pirellulales bacterium]|nr:hypothetical protein [Pirellulales bacterium]